MFFKVSWSEDFDSLMMHLWAKYGRKLFTMDGIGDQCDLNLFSKNFFNNPNSTADVSVDANANVVAKTGIEYNFEMPKPLRRYNSYYLLWKELRKHYGHLYANQVIEQQLTGHIYINDFISICEPYCFNYSTYDISLHGLDGISKRLHVAAPQSLSTFLRQVEQFMVVAANSTLGATGFADLLIVGSKYVDKIIETGKDGHVSIAPENLETYIKEKLTEFVYTVNWEFRGNQSPFSNVSVYDDLFLNSLCPDYGANMDTVKMMQRIYISVMNEEMERTPLTFPVTTACFSIDENKNIQDEKFLRFIAEANKKFGFINIYNGSTATLSSCCFSGNTPILWKSSLGGKSSDRQVMLTSLREAYELPWTDRKNMRIFHNGNWVDGKIIRVPRKPMYRVTTMNNKTFELTEDHLNPTFRGDIRTDQLTLDDWLMFNTKQLDAVPEQDESLTYSHGYIIGCFLGNGSFGSRKNGTTSEIAFSMNESNVTECLMHLHMLSMFYGLTNHPKLGEMYNNVYPIRTYSRELVSFIQKWTNWSEGTFSFNKQLNLDCLLQSAAFRLGILYGWYATDGGNSNRCYTTSPKLKDQMEVLITSLGLNSSIDVSDRTDEKVVIRGEEYDRNYPLWCVRWYDPKNKRTMNPVYHFYNNSQFFKIRSIVKIEYEDEFVYCIERTDQTEPYFTLPCGLITHNCRLRSERKSEYFNSFGSGSTKIGSLGVVTANLPRAAYLANGNTEKFLDNVHELFIAAQRINSCKRKLIQKRIDLGAAPLYTHGYMELSKQYSTFGIVGVNEAVQLLGKDILQPEGQALVVRLLDSISQWIEEAEAEEHAPHNVEQVPAESSAVKLAQKDKMLGYDIGVPLYSNQFIPLITQADMFDRLRLQGMFDNKLSGGAIAHINVGSPIENTDTIMNLMKYAAKQGVVYWAINYKLNCCKNKHTWVGTDNCPKCGSHWDSQITRVVGFFTTVKNWNPTRREEDWPNRQFYDEEHLQVKD